MINLDPGTNLVPVLLPASTNLRALDAKTVSYGFMPMCGITADDVVRLAHGPNERIAIEDVAFGIAATAQIAYRLGRIRAA
jgi:acetylornithine deacetylase/succinyl-diaminopimelate desuccinylase-like protein